jgi:hypothetical protein
VLLASTLRAADLVVMLGGAVGIGLPMAAAIIWVCS